MRTIGFLMVASLWPFSLVKNNIKETGDKTAPFHFSWHNPGLQLHNSGANNKTNTDTIALKQSNWYADAMQQIEESEYAIKQSGAANSFASPNRQQNLRAVFSADKFTLEPRKDNNWKLELSVQGVYSRTKRIYTPCKDAVAAIEKNQICFTHNNEFAVEYINSKEGIRQNFIIKKEPVSKPRALNIKLKINKGWFINQAHPKEIHFAKVKEDKIEKKITYNSLKAWDADNKELAASFSIKENIISINVNTIDAVYPVTIDPLSTAPDSTPDDADQANSGFGYSVSSAGDVNGDGYSDVIIGAYSYDDGGNTDEGRAFVYHGSATGLSSTPNSTPDDADLANANFGISVSTAGDVNGDGYSDVIIGASAYNDGGNNFEGRAYIYHGSSTGLLSFPSAVLDDANQAGAVFGCTTACAGDVNGDGYSDVIIGAGGYDDGPYSEEGRAYVHYGSASGVSLTPASILDDADQSSAYFALRSLAGAGDVNGDGYSDVIVGADNYDEVSTANEGRAFVYYGSAAGLSASPDWVADDANQVNAFLGTGVASAGDINGDGYGDVIIGAEQYDDGANVNEGVAFIYYGSSSGLAATPASMLDDADQASAFFGCSVNCAGDVNGDGFSDVIIGAKFYTDGGNTNEGRAFVYLGSASGVAATPFNTPDDADQAVAYFGLSVASAGDVNGDGYSDIIIGAYLYDDAGNTNEGRAFLYQGSPDGLNAAAANWTAESNQTGAAMGFHITGVASAGDVNGDGYSDVIIGIPYYDNGQTDEGVVWVYYGSATGLPSSPNWTAESDQANAYFGVAVSWAGDVNGDGYGDVIIGANYFDNGQTDEGRVFVYHGSASGLSLTANWTAESNQAGANMGQSVAGAGDVNGDGYGDVIVGAMNYDNTFTDEGAAFVYYGSGTGLLTTPAWTVYGGQASDFFSHSVAGAGDVNGDGFSDVIVGAHYYDNGQTDEGKAFLYNGSSSGLSTTANWTGEGNSAGAGYGVRVASAGDVNGDGYGDVIIGAHTYSNGQSQEGAAYVYHGSSAGLSLTANWNIESNTAGAYFGIVSSAGDVNGDGYSDVLVGAIFYTNGESSEGKAFVYHGSSTGLSVSPGWSYESNQAGASFSYSLACAGDVNGDGFSDILVGAPWYDNGETDEGKVFLFYGNKNGGMRDNLRLYNADLITPIQQSNMGDPNLFGAGLYAKSFIGKQKGKMVWQTVKNGNPFTGSPITNSTAYTSQQASFSNLGLSGLELKNQIAKQTPTKATYIRARVKYDLVTAITGQVYGPWRYPEGFLRGRRDVGSVALPVKFISFTATKQDQSSLLKWITTNEEPATRFEVQHSTDGIRFISLTAINSRNQSLNEYEWQDNNPAKGKNYYRIRAVENEKEAITGVRLLDFIFSGDITVYPNPASASQNIIICNDDIKSGKPVEITMTSYTGQIVMQKGLVAAVDGRISLTVPQLPAGNYIVGLQTDGSRNKTSVIFVGN